MNKRLTIIVPDYDIKHMVLDFAHYGYDSF